MEVEELATLAFLAKLCISVTYFSFTSTGY